MRVSAIARLAGTTRWRSTSMRSRPRPSSPTGWPLRPFARRRRREYHDAGRGGVRRRVGASSRCRSREWWSHALRKTTRASGSCVRDGERIAALRTVRGGRATAAATSACSACARQARRRGPRAWRSFSMRFREFYARRRPARDARRRRRRTRPAPRGSTSASGMHVESEHVTFEKELA